MSALKGSPPAWVLLVAGVAILAILSCARSEKGPDTDRVRTRTMPGNGLYAVLNEAATEDSARVAGRTCVVLPYDRKYLASGHDEPLTYVAIDTTSWVPLILDGPPEAERDESRRALLSVTLAEPYVRVLEEFTTRHLDGRAAIVLDGEIISVHRIRAVIREGRLQITRCDEDDCEVLLSRLTR